MLEPLDNACFVGFDTSNYTTSVAACDQSGRVIANVKRLLTVKEGDRGLRQSEAVFLHVKNLREILDELGGLIEGRVRVAVGVSSRPRSVDGSYMPCFLVGEAAAKSFASAAEIPCYFFSHQDGHVMAALYSAMNGDEERIESSLREGFAAFHVSGGTTELLLVRPCGGDFSVEKIGGTTDLNAGQAIDRTGVAMGLRFPCGPEMERLANANTLPVPRKKVSVSGLECCLSGLENLTLGLYKETGSPECVSAFVFQYVAQVLDKLTENLRMQYPGLPVVYAGGVMSNGIIKNILSARENVFFARPEFSADNAAGIALLCRRRHLRGQ